MSGFKKFLLQGNVVELAVAVIIAGAFGKVVEAVVKVLLDLIGMVGGNPNFDKVAIGDLVVGPVITAIVAFIVLAAVVYFLIVKPYEAATARMATSTPDEVEAESAEVALLTEIRDTLKARS